MIGTLSGPASKVASKRPPPCFPVSLAATEIGEDSEQNSPRHVADLKFACAADLAAACIRIATGPWVISALLPGDIVLIYSFQKTRNG